MAIARSCVVAIVGFTLRSESPLLPDLRKGIAAAARHRNPANIIGNSSSRRQRVSRSLPQCPDNFIADSLELVARIAGDQRGEEPTAAELLVLEDPWRNESRRYAQANENKGLVIEKRESERRGGGYAGRCPRHRLRSLADRCRRPPFATRLPCLCRDRRSINPNTAGVATPIERKKQMIKFVRDQVWANSDFGSGLTLV